MNDRAIREAVRGGACSLRQVARACGAARRCGGCRPAVSELIEEEQALPETTIELSAGAIAAS